MRVWNMRGVESVGFRQPNPPARAILNNHPARINFRLAKFTAAEWTDSLWWWCHRPFLPLFVNPLFPFLLQRCQVGVGDECHRTTTGQTITVNDRTNIATASTDL